MQVTPIKIPPFPYGRATTFLITYSKDGETVGQQFRTITEALERLKQICVGGSYGSVTEAFVVSRGPLCGKNGETEIALSRLVSRERHVTRNRHPVYGQIWGREVYTDYTAWEAEPYAISLLTDCSGEVVSIQAIPASKIW